MSDNVFQEWSRYTAGLKKMPDYDDFKQINLQELEATQHFNDTEIKDSGQEKKANSYNRQGFEAVSGMQQS